MPPIPRCLLTTTDPDALGRVESMSRASSPSASESERATTRVTPHERVESGRVPNLFWRAVAMEDLRASPDFDALPDESSVALAGARSFAYVRQGTAAWDALHDGRLTTGILKACLGFNEEYVDKRALGLGRRGHGGHHAILNAVHRLRRTKWCEDEVEESLAVEASRETPSCEKALQWRRERRRGRERRRRGCDRDAAGRDEFVAGRFDGVSRGATPEVEKEEGFEKKKRGKKMSCGKKNRAAGDGAQMLTNAQYSRAVAHGGEQAIRLAWGSAQEASTLTALMTYYEQCTVHEAGLCMLDVSKIPKHWNVGPLPPVGASPDGLITMSNGERFVVEVKNSSPFRSTPGSFVIADREPYNTPPAYHMPQVQLEMMCTDTNAALLAMQSMTYGIRIFRVERDDAFIASMLRRISRLYTTYVLKDKDPPMNWEIRSTEHKRNLVGAAVRLASEATVYDHIPSGLLPDDGSIVVDENAFLPS